MKWVTVLITIWLMYVGVARSRIPAHVLPISIDVTPIACLEPCTIRVDVTIPPKLENRSAVIEVDGMVYFTSTTIPLEGDRAAKHHIVTFRNLPADDYSIRGLLSNSIHETSRHIQHITVEGHVQPHP